jgi:hypothetical protein
MRSGFDPANPDPKENTELVGLVLFQLVEPVDAASA